MRFVIQRVNYASVTVDEQIVGKIDKGLLVFVGISQYDTKEIADKLVKKLCGLRIFEDSNNKTNLALSDVNGELLIVSQFTLYADCRKGFRPSFTQAGSPGSAEILYEYIVEKCKDYVSSVQHGIFGADMKVELLNDGPFTIILETDSAGNII